MDKKRYIFQKARSGESVPALVDSTGRIQPLHSMVDPRREARRLIDTVKNEGFLVLLGLGGGFYAEAALERDDIEVILIVEYDKNELDELFCFRDYSRLLSDPRVRLLTDKSAEEIKQHILELYKPVLHNGIRVIPLRARTDFKPKAFALAAEAIQAAIDQLSADYSVQAHFGKRWFSNIIKNISNWTNEQNVLPNVNDYIFAVCAAGPSLSQQIEQLKEKRRKLFIIATDTSLPCLLYEKIIPDAVISIDCQHISYYHFLEARNSGLPQDIPLFLDIASPPLLLSLFHKHYFFSGGHPLTSYFSQVYGAIPELDCSGGNVTYAALSLAEQLGGKKIELYGSDFSYPHGVTYARGAYIYSFFESRQNRFSPLEAQGSRFLYRTPLKKKYLSETNWYYETETLEFYRKKIAEKQEQKKNGFYSGKPRIKAKEFLEKYKKDICNLSMPAKTSEEWNLLATILPFAAALKHRSPQTKFSELLEQIKNYCQKALNV